MKKKDLLGKKFGRWTVVGSRKTDKGRFEWKVICDCGKEGFNTSNSLTSERSKSCGCLRSEWSRNKWLEYRKTRPKDHAAKTYFYNIYKSGAKSRKLAFDLTREEFRDIVRRDCSYCGSKPREYSLGNNNDYELVCNGVDRVDSKKGYSISNCVPCCSNCNVMKQSLSLKDFKDHILKIYLFSKLGENNE